MISCVLWGANTHRSRSPEIHQRAASALGVPLRYRAESVPNLEALRSRFDAWRRSEHGANVTAPFKGDVVPWCDRLSPLARRLGAVNTLVRRPDGAVEGENTDGPGFLALLESMAPELRRRVGVLGAGGVVPAVLWAATQVGGSDVWVAARRPEAARAQSMRFPGVRGVRWGSWDAADLVVSAVPSAAAVPLLRAPGLAEARWMDLSYAGPGENTPLVEAVLSAGGEAQDGYGLLVEQGARSFSLWTGIPVARVRAAMGAPAF